MTVMSASGDNFHFVSAQAPGSNDSKRRARSHAVKQALQRKRNGQLESQNNFRIISSESIAEDAALKKRMIRKGTSVVRAPSACMLDPFQVLAVDSRRFQRLLYDNRAMQASEPVFSVTSDSSFHSFATVFRGGLDDPALGNAAMFMLTFSIAEGAINQEGLMYQSLALSQIREKMSSIDKATSLSTFGAILFLTGVEARLGMRAQAQVHLQAIQQLLDIGRKRGMLLTAGIKRAIFWQDLNASIMTGSDRIVDHHTFVEMNWQRDPFASHFYELPVGFRALTEGLGSDFVTILEDVHALQLIRDQARTHAAPDPLDIAYINNHQASIQSRLVALKDLDPVMDCIRLAAYLCSSMLCCRIWCGQVIPRHISTQLLRRLQLDLDDPSWDDNVELLRWVVLTGACFAFSTSVRAEYATLLKERIPRRFSSTRENQFLQPLPDLSRSLGQFVWSEGAFSAYVGDFWAKGAVFPIA